MVSDPGTLSEPPPALLISGTRDFALGGVRASHNKLVSFGAEADLHVWEGQARQTSPSRTKCMT